MVAVLRANNLARSLFFLTIAPEAHERFRRNGEPYGSFSEDGIPPRGIYCMVMRRYWHRPENLERAVREFLAHARSMPSLEVVVVTMHCPGFVFAISDKAKRQRALRGYLSVQFGILRRIRRNLSGCTRVAIYAIAEAQDIVAELRSRYRDLRSVEIFTDPREVR
ncbi:MAG TPA: hypothetical protein PLP17_17705 [Oligoflexia bacterium]|nr:hypothetical protein [Oligoflexia bacterium]